MIDSYSLYLCIFNRFWRQIWSHNDVILPNNLNFCSSLTISIGVPVTASYVLVEKFSSACLFAGLSISKTFWKLQCSICTAVSYIPSELCRHQAIISNSPNLKTKSNLCFSRIAFFDYACFAHKT